MTVAERCPDTKVPAVSVLIPAINEVDTIAAAIKSAVQAGADQIVLCDGGSTDATVRTAERSGATDIVTSDLGRGVQLAAGLPRCGGDMIVVLHADNALSLDSLTAIRRRLLTSSTDAGMWGGFRQRIDAPERIYRWLEHGNAMRVRGRGMVFGDQAMFFSKSLIDQVGGIPAVPLMEDVLLSRRLRRLQRPVLLDPVVRISDRRWRQRGVARQTWLNLRIQLAHKFGADEETLRRWYQ